MKILYDFFLKENGQFFGREEEMTLEEALDYAEEYDLTFKETDRSNKKV